MNDYVSLDRRIPTACLAFLLMFVLLVTPERVLAGQVRDPDGDQWYCTKIGYATCYFKTHGEGGQACPSAGGSHPSTSSQNSVCGWIADNCGCNEGYKEVPDPPTSTSKPPMLTPKPPENGGNGGSSGLSNATAVPIGTCNPSQTGYCYLTRIQAARKLKERLLEVLSSITTPQAP